MNNIPAHAKTAFIVTECNPAVRLLLYRFLNNGLFDNRFFFNNRLLLYRLLFNNSVLCLKKLLCFLWEDRLKCVPDDNYN